MYLVPAELSGESIWFENVILGYLSRGLFRYLSCNQLPLPRLRFLFRSRTASLSEAIHQRFVLLLVFYPIQHCALARRFVSFGRNPFCLSLLLLLRYTPLVTIAAFVADQFMCDHSNQNEKRRTSRTPRDER